MSELPLLTDLPQLAAGPSLIAFNSQNQDQIELALDKFWVGIKFHPEDRTFELFQAGEAPDPTTHFRMEMKIDPANPGDCDQRQPSPTGLHRFCFESDLDGSHFGGFGVVVITDIVIHDPNFTDVQERQQKRGQFSLKKQRPGTRQEPGDAQLFQKQMKWEIGSHPDTSLFLRSFSRIRTLPSGVTRTDHFLEVFAPHAATDICLRPLQA